MTTNKTSHKLLRLFHKGAVIAYMNTIPTTPTSALRELQLAMQLIVRNDNKFDAPPGLLVAGNIPWPADIFYKLGLKSVKQYSTNIVAVHMSIKMKPLELREHVYYVEDEQPLTHILITGYIFPWRYNLVTVVPYDWSEEDAEALKPVYGCAPEEYEALEIDPLAYIPEPMRDFQRGFETALVDHVMNQFKLGGLE